MDARAITNSPCKSYSDSSDPQSSIIGLIKPVKTQTFLGHSFDCQQRAAGINKKMNGEISNRDTGMVAYRYLQCRKGFYKTLFQSVVYTICTIGAALYSQNPLSACFALFTASNAIINARNAVKYNEQTAIAGKFLQGHISQKTFTTIKTLGYNDDGLKKLYKTLLDDGVNVERLKEQLKSRKITVDA